MQMLMTHYSIENGKYLYELTKERERLKRVKKIRKLRDLIKKKQTLSILQNN